MEIFISETETTVLGALERLEVKMITYEHITRRRLVKEKRVSVHKIEKLLDVLPQVMGVLGNDNKSRELPGAALCCLSFGAKDVKNERASEVQQSLQNRYKHALLEIADSLQLSRNILIAILSLQSWKPFMHRWLRASMTVFDAKVSSAVLDKTSDSANGILKWITQTAEDTLPRSAENIALAIGALCLVLPSSAHAVRSAASEFLLSWLFQHEHEYRQWSAAISLGVITSCLHLTDHNQKFDNINALLEVACSCKSTLVKGACGVGLGFSCQNLFTKIKTGGESNSGEEMFKTQETKLLGKIVRTLAQLISQFAQSSSDALDDISSYFTPVGKEDFLPNISTNNIDCSEEDIWGISGLIMGLGSTVPAIYRSGCSDAVVNIKNLILSWIPHVNPLAQSSSSNETWEIVLSVGSCLALPVILSFCQRVELIDGTELEHIINGFRDLINELLSIKKSGAFHQSLLMASCVGAGNVLAGILYDGAHCVNVEHINELLVVFKEIYSNPHPSLVHFGGMLGVVNSLGAGAGALFQHYPVSSMDPSRNHKESSFVMGPLLASAVMEPRLTSSVQDIFLVARTSDDHQLQQYAAWAASFLRHHLSSKELQNENSNVQMSASQSVPEDSMVMKLSTWLMNLDSRGTETKAPLEKVATCLRCLSHAPRLPQLDWGAIVRRCMRYEGQLDNVMGGDYSDLKERRLREECFMFCLAHAHQFDRLLTYLDELCDLPRLRMLEIKLQFCILSHVADIVKIFSGSRVEKLFDDVAKLILACSCEQLYSPKQKSLLRASCWKGLRLCFNEASLNSQGYSSSMENCMEVLFSLLPECSNSETISAVKFEHLEWSEAVRCLGKARSDWLLNLLQITEQNFDEGSIQFSEAKKKIRVKVRLVRIGSFPLIDIGKLKNYLLNSRSEAIWDVLVEVSAALHHAEESVKRKWLLDAVEISCVTSYPSTALRFIGLLCGSLCKYMPLLFVDPFSVLNVLPVTLTSLLVEDASWKVVAESVVSHLWTATVRIQCWVTKTARGDDGFPSQLIDESEDSTSFLLHIMHRTCINLKDYLPEEKQLELASMVLS